MEPGSITKRKTTDAGKARLALKKRERAINRS
jgi:hypothetical protein